MKATKRIFIGLAALAASSLTLAGCGASEETKEEQSAPAVAGAEAEAEAEEEAVEPAEGTLVTSDDGFEVLFPGPPEMEESEQGGGTVTTWTYEDPQGNAWIFTHTSAFVAEGIGGETARDVAKSAVEFTIRETGAEVVRQNNDETLQGLPAVSAEMTVTQGDTVQTLCDMSAVAPENWEAYSFTTVGVGWEQFQAFTGSFRLLD